MGRLRVVGILVLASVFVLSWSAGIAGDFYVIPVNRVFISWDKKLPASERFKFVFDGEAVLDKETGLVWAKNANLDGAKGWQIAVDYCRNLNLGGRMGWRLPTIEEITSLVDRSQTNPALPSGHLFTNVQSEDDFSDYSWITKTSA